MDTAKAVSGMVWQPKQYDRIPSGKYTAIVTAYQGPEFVYRFNRWCLRFDCAIPAEGKVVSAFFNLGTNREAPEVKRHSKYAETMMLALGDSMRRGMVLDPRRLINAVFEVRVGDPERKKRKPLPESMMYSVVLEFLECITPPPDSPEC